MKKIGLYLRALKNNPILTISAVVVIMISASAFFFILNDKNSTIPIQDTVQDNQTVPASGESAAGRESAGTVFVDVSGCVKHPGVYEVTSTSTSINQAEPVTDGQKINVPDKKSEPPAQGSSAAAEQQSSDGKVSINTADSEELQKIPGVGPVTAENIISYRESNGSFKSIDDIKNVSGIGEKTFEKMKSTIVL